jgi:hypothetical protein
VLSGIQDGLSTNTEDERHLATSRQAWNHPIRDCKCFGRTKFITVAYRLSSLWSTVRRNCLLRSHVVHRYSLLSAVQRAVSIRYIGKWHLSIPLLLERNQDLLLAVALFAPTGIVSTLCVRSRKRYSLVFEKIRGILACVLLGFIAHKVPAHWLFFVGCIATGLAEVLYAIMKVDASYFAFNFWSQLLAPIGVDVCK